MADESGLGQELERARRHLTIVQRLLSPASDTHDEVVRTTPPQVTATNSTQELATLFSLPRGSRAKSGSGQDTDSARPVRSWPAIEASPQ